MSSSISNIINSSQHVLLYMTLIDLGAYIARKNTRTNNTSRTSQTSHNWCIVFCILSALNDPKLRRPTVVALLARLTSLGSKWKSLLHIVRLVAYTMLFRHVVVYTLPRNPSAIVTKATLLPIMGFGGVMAIHHIETLRYISKRIRNVFVLDVGSSFTPHWDRRRQVK